MRITVKLPDGFDPLRHSKALEKKITDKHGGGFEIDSISEGVAVATRQVTITEVSTNTASRTKDVRLPRTVKPSDGEKMAVKLADQHGEGWEMTRFEPFLGRATLTQLTDEMGRCRGAAAVALGVKPWDVQVNSARTADSTWNCRNPMCRPSTIRSSKRSLPVSSAMTAGF